MPFDRDARQGHHAQGLVAGPVRVGQLRHDGDAQTLADHFDNRFHRVELDPLADSGAALCQGLVDQMTRPGVAVKPHEGALGEHLQR